MASASGETGSYEQSKIARERRRVQTRDRWHRTRLDILYFVISSTSCANARGRRRRRVSGFHRAYDYASTETPRKTGTTSTDPSDRPLQEEIVKTRPPCSQNDSGLRLHLVCTHQVCVVHLISVSNDLHFRTAFHSLILSPTSFLHVSNNHGRKRNTCPRPRDATRLHHRSGQRLSHIGRRHASGCRENCSPRPS